MTVNSLPSTCSGVLGEATAPRDAAAQCPPTSPVKEIPDGFSGALVNAECNHAAAPQSLLRPIHSVSNDILHEIFSYCVPNPATSNEMLVGVDSLYPHAAPWTLTCVCHEWRELVISSPLLWTYFLFEVDFRHGRSRDDQQCAERMRIYLERSRSLSLSIHIVDIMGEMANSPMIPVLIRALPRCTCLTLQASTVFVQALYGTVFSRLRRLVVSTAFMSFKTADVHTFTAISAPELRNVSSHDSRWDSMRFVAIPWSQVTEVYRLPIFDNISLVWLREIPHVRILSVSVVRSSFIPLDTAISLPELDNLTLIEAVDARPGCLKEFMSALALDTLTCLMLEYPRSRRPVFPSLTGGFADRLTALSIKCTTERHSDDAKELLDFITQCSQLIELLLADISLGAPFVTGLRCFPTSSILRCLRYLDISQCLGSPDDLPALLDMLESRCTNVSEQFSGAEQDVCLRKLRVPDWLYFEKDSRWDAIRTRKNVEVTWR
ncbi:hypothetical protein CPB85DRAFT_1565736 [Mucidula mucida]|nr:hypothetical protein CPB85DRAFT_1565736 [Mucidula mucida]